MVLNGGVFNSTHLARQRVRAEPGLGRCSWRALVCCAWPASTLLPGRSLFLASGLGTGALRPSSIASPTPIISDSHHRGSSRPQGTQADTGQTASLFQNSCKLQGERAVEMIPQYFPD